MAEGRSREGIDCITRYLLISILTLSLIMVPASAGAVPNGSPLHNATGPQVVYVGTFVQDFNRLDIKQGSVEVLFFANLHSDTPFSIRDFEVINGQISQVTEISDTPTEKNYRFFAVMTLDPDLRNFPFDTQTLPIIIEPKNLTEQSLVLVIDTNESGLAKDAGIPGWEFTGTQYSVTNQSYDDEVTPYSRAIFSYGITRDSASTVLKFFVPILIIVIISLASLMMKVTSRLGVNASMFLAAVMIHWRLADAVPVVAYATFLDVFMIITYAILLMVLISSMLILTSMESRDTARVEQIYRWSIRIIPLLSVFLYLLLFLSLVL
jgi:hypothetical protein